MEGTTPRPPSQVRGVLAAGQHVQDGTEESGHLPPCFSSVSSRTRTTSEPQNTENDFSGYFSIPPKMVNNTAKSEINSSYTGEASALANFSCQRPYSRVEAVQAEQTLLQRLCPAGCVPLCLPRLALGHWALVFPGSSG